MRENPYTTGMVNMSMIYANEYKKDGRNFITCFLKFASIRSVCREIVLEYKKLGAFEDCLKCGKNFVTYANKQELPEKWKSVLADILLIIYNLNHFPEVGE